jgi:predicted Holliday junction resolvase-like endonuclease
MPPLDDTLKTIDHASRQDDRWLFIALLVIGLITIWFLARYFMRQVEALQREIVATRTEFEQHLKTANAEMVAALTKSSEIIAQNSAILEQIHQRLGADGGREFRADSARNGR